MCFSSFFLFYFLLKTQHEIWVIFFRFGNFLPFLRLLLFFPTVRKILKIIFGVESCGRNFLWLNYIGFWRAILENRLQIDFLSFQGFGRKLNFQWGYRNKFDFWWWIWQVISYFKLFATFLYWDETKNITTFTHVPNNILRTKQFTIQLPNRRTTHTKYSMNKWESCIIDQVRISYKKPNKYYDRLERDVIELFPHTESY